MKALQISLFICCACLMNACISPKPVQYYTLSAPSLINTPKHAPDIHQNPKLAFELQPVILTEQLDRQAMVLRYGASEIRISDNPQWSSPFADEIHDALSDALSNQLATHDISTMAQTSNPNAIHINLQVHRWEIWPSHGIQISTSWRLSSTQQATHPLICHSHFSEQELGDMSQIVQHQQRLIQKLATQIAQTARNWAIAPKSTPCP